MTRIARGWRKRSAQTPASRGSGRRIRLRFTRFSRRGSIRDMRSGLPVFLAVAAINPAVAADVQKIRDSAEKGLALVQLSQKGWNRSCVSCHQQLLPALAFQAAREHGIKFDEVAARRQSERAFSLYANLDRAIEYTHIVDPAM